MSRYHAEIRMHNGAPSMFVNDLPIFLNAPYLRKAPLASFAAAGTGIYLLSDGPIKVDADGHPSTEAAERAITELLDEEPGALVIVRSFPPTPRWWLDAHPDEEMQFDRDIRSYPGLADYRDVSWTSDAWLDASSGWYESWCRRLHQRFDGQVVGYQFGMGSCGENNPLGGHGGRWFCSDFSPAMTRYFRRWLAQRYGSDEALRRAWSDPSASIETAKPPSRLERLRSDWLTFRSPLRAHVADYYLALAERVTHCVIRFCEASKRATEGHSLAGSHLGAFMDNGFHAYVYSQASINRVLPALEHPAVDLLTSPASYDHREPGGEASSMMPAGSVALHGKLIFQDQDTRTFHVSDEYRRNFNLARIAADLRQTEDSLKRDVAHMVIRGYGCWWHAMVPGMYDHPGISECLARLARIGRRSLAFPRGTADGIAMIVDEESVYHQQCANRLFYSMLYYQRQHFWSRSGAAWNAYLHNDLAAPRMPDHKVYYFLNTFYLSDEEVAAIEKKVKRNNATVIWSYAPGIQSPDGFTLERVHRLTGFRVKAADVEALPRVTLTNHDHPLVRYRREGEGDEYMRAARQPDHFGVGPMGSDERERIVGPLFYVDDPEATVLGELDALQEPGFCVKQMDGWTSVFVSAPMLNHYLLRNIAREAGLHIYSEDNDVILPGRSFVMQHAVTPGRKRITLPHPADVLECYDDMEAGRSIQQIDFDLPEYGTRFYFTGDIDAYRRT